MKKKIGEIYNKPIVIGDKNLVTKNEIHESNLIGSSSSNEEAFEYLDVSNENVYGIDVLAIAALECKGVSDAISIVAPVINVQPFVEAVGITITQLKVDFNTLIVMNQEGTITKQTALEMLLSKGITQDKLAAIPRITKEEFYNLNSSDNSGESTVKEGDLIYYALNDSFTSIGNITDNITQIAVSRGESMSSGSVGNLNRFVDIQEVTINKGDDYVSISIPNFIVIDMPAFVYKVGSDLKTAEDIIGNSSVTRITKEEYDNIFNM